MAALSLNIRNETAALSELLVCRGTAVPDFDGFHSDHPEFETFTMLRWDRDRLLEQQEAFYALMQSQGVRLHMMPHSDAHPWAMYTRDTGFVIGDRLYYSDIRELPERAGEIALVRTTLPDLGDDDLVEISSGKIEGGDVLVDDDTVFVGLGTRTSTQAVAELGRHVDVTPIPLGPRVMHLDCRMTILPRRHALICTQAFRAEDLAMLRRRFTLIEVAPDEARAMGTNVFVVNPDLVVVHSGFPRIIAALRAAGLGVAPLDWSEPNALLGSFRCATMPLARTP